MSENELEPVSPDLAELFEQERREHRFPDAMQASVLAGVERAVHVSVLHAGLDAAEHIATRAASLGQSAPLWKRAATVALSFAAGAGATELVHRATSRPEAPPNVPAALPAPVLSSTPSAAAPKDAAPEPVMPAPTASVERAPRAPVASAAPAPSPARAPTPSPQDAQALLAREREIIDTGRVALSRGRSEDALAAVRVHEREFPSGRLTEEREVLAIQALRLAHRDGEATARAARFHARYPSSIYAGAVDP